MALLVPVEITNYSVNHSFLQHIEKLANTAVSNYFGKFKPLQGHNNKGKPYSYLRNHKKIHPKCAPQTTVVY